MKSSLLKYVNKVDATSGNDTSINSFVSSTSPGIVIPEQEPMLTETVEQCGCAMSFTSEPVIQADAEPTVANLGLGIRNTYCAENILSQNLKSDLSLKGRQFGKKIRYVRKEYFIRKLVNGEIVSRDWLIYSPTTGKVFPYICKIFGCKTGSAGTKNAPRNQFITGFDDWKNVIARITPHEKSKDHFAAVSMIMQYKKSTRIDFELQKENEKSCKYWTEVLKRVVVVIKFLAERGLAFRAEFDPFLREHIQRYGNPGKENVSYLSANICDEFINILGGKVLKQIISEIKDAKYYGNSIDSTPDISHVDQLTLVIRYVLKNRNVVERFLQFIPIEHHDGEYLFNLVVGILQFHGIDIKNCRSQSYYNASNMNGIYSASTKRWSTLKELLKENVFVLQSLSETRWSSRSDSTKAFYANYLQIRQALCEVTNSKHQPPAAVHEAKSLVKHLHYFETALMCVIWKDLLQKMNIVNKALQEPGIELCTIIKLYDGLIQYFYDTRSKFETFEGQAKDLTESDYKEAT
ncbi:uncharacterized protein LOC136075971 [Hydra vulgaris]|uniref:Uncharacterized protein LOC136075971 n=1 Tax=Hydra vulgaris TaxID=6087 RepID=A0ABM4B9C1_HYDVU